MESQFTAKEIDHTKMEDFEDFEKKVENIGNLVRGLISGELHPDAVQAEENTSERCVETTKFLHI